MESQSVLSDTSYQNYEDYGDNLRIAAVSASTGIR